MAGEYKPSYVPEEIAVCFKNSCTKDFAAHYGEALGATLKPGGPAQSYVFVYQTRKGKEQEVCDAFSRRPLFVRKAERIEDLI
jgi:hypothetical protein